MDKPYILNCTKWARLQFFFFLLCCTPSLALHAQGKNDANTGSVKGKVKDSVYNFVLSSATVAVYKDADSGLLRFTIPNNLGEFLLEPLPVDVPLRLIVTHVGFQSLLRRFAITKENRARDLGWLYLHQADSAGADVVVRSVAPMRMNGDTVEFNAAAFRLDSNATAEDLIRRLPGFTVWGDGDITYNGKKINAVTVEGKPFMGGTDMTVATQNIPKDAIDKIQVYQQRDDKNPLDSTLYANIKLREDKKFGYFGKVSAGGGTDGRYAGDGMLSCFNKKMQLSAVGAANNINKMANNVDVLMKNASFKGAGANTDYQSDFTLRGLNTPVAVGARLQYDFIPDVAYQKSSRLNADFFMNGDDNLINSTLTTNTVLGTDSILSRKSVNSNGSTSNNTSLNTSYGRSTPRYNLNLSAALAGSRTSSNSTGNSQQEQTGIGTVSMGTNATENKNTSQDLNLSAEYHNNDVLDFGTRQGTVPREFVVKYTLGQNNYSGNGHTRSAFISNTAPSSSTEYDRLYAQKNGHTTNHGIYTAYPQLKRLLFGRGRIWDIGLSLSNTLNLSNGNYTTRVSDLDTATHTYRPNGYLTNVRDVTVTDASPVLAISKSFSKGLTNRYSKNLSVDVNLREQFYSFRHIATQAVQNIQYGYARFIPNLSIGYRNHQYGEYEISASLNASAKANYPVISQMAPLVDSTNAWYIPKGNAHLRPEAEKDFSFNLTATSRRPKNPSEIQFGANFSYVNDNIADSVLYNSSGQQTSYSINLDGAKSLNGNIGYRKAFESRHHTFRLQANYGYSLYRTPGYINSMLNVSQGNGHSGMVNISYSHRDIVTLRLEQSVSYYQSEQKGFNNSRFVNNNRYTRFSGALQSPKNLVWSSNITYNMNSSNSSSAIGYTIWNGSLTYRFLHGNRGEVKFAAMDLLHNNKSIINTNNGFSQTIGYNNVLQQYFLLTLSYYPRKFGK